MGRTPTGTLFDYKSRVAKLLYRCYLRRRGSCPRTCPGVSSERTVTVHTWSGVRWPSPLSVIPPEPKRIFKKGERPEYLKVEKQESYLGWGRSKLTRIVAVSFEYLSALIWLGDKGKNVRERSLDWRLSLFVPEQVQLRKRGFLGLGKVLKEAGTTSWGPRRECQKDGGGVLGQSAPPPLCFSLGRRLSSPPLQPTVAWS